MKNKPHYLFCIFVYVCESSIRNELDPSYGSNLHLLRALAHTTAAQLEALYALLVPLGAHAPGTADGTHGCPSQFYAEENQKEINSTFIIISRSRTVYFYCFFFGQSISTINN